MTKEEAIALLQDCVQIAKYLQWDSAVGKQMAARLMVAIHEGKYGLRYGIWPQADEAIKVLLHDTDESGEQK